MNNAITAAACPLCGKSFARSYRVDGTPVPLRFAACPDCGIAIRAEPESVQALYDDHYSEGITGGFRSEGKDRHDRFTLRALARHAAPPGRLLDIGCAAGDFLDAARRSGWEVAGVEMQERSAALARAKGIPVHSPFLDAIPAGETFDAITMLDVFEHIRDPAGFLPAVAARLAPGGVLYVETPNFGSIFRRLRGGAWMAFIPFHEILYSPRALARTLVAARLDILFQTTYAASPLCYDGLRRLRIHEPFYNAGLLVSSALRKAGSGALTRSALLRSLASGISTVLNWPFEISLARLLHAGDQLITIARPR